MEIDKRQFEVFGTLARTARVLPDTSVRHLPETIAEMRRLLDEASLVANRYEGRGTKFQTEMCLRMRRVISAVKDTIEKLADVDSIKELDAAVVSYDRHVLG